MHSGVAGKRGNEFLRTPICSSAIINSFFSVYLAWGTVHHGSFYTLMVLYFQVSYFLLQIIERC